MDKAELLGNLPATLRDELVDEYNKLTKNYRESKWEPSEMSGGKICEIVYSILDGFTKGNFPSRSFKPDNMVDACKALEQTPSSFKRTVRIQIPRVLVALYEVRNNRGAGHVGGDVDPNHMDATYVLASAKWLMAELIRLFHDVDTVTANEAVELLTERETPMIWNINGLKRVLDVSLNKRDQTLVLLYGIPSAKDTELSTWVEHSNLSVYRKKILVEGHKQRLWEYDQNNLTVTISRLGSELAEKILEVANKPV